MHNNVVQNFFQTNRNTQLLVQKFFDRPMGLAFALIAQFGFLRKVP